MREDGSVDRIKKDILIEAISKPEALRRAAEQGIHCPVYIIEVSAFTDEHGNYIDVDRIMSN